MKKFNKKNKIFFQTKKLNNFILNLKLKKKKKWNILKKFNCYFLKKKFKKRFKRGLYFKNKYKIFLEHKKIKKFTDNLFFNFLIKKKYKLSVNFKLVLFLILKNKTNLKKLFIFLYFKNNIKNLKLFLKYIKIKKKITLFKNLKKKITLFKNLKKKKFFKAENRLLPFQHNNQEFFRTGLYIKQVLKKNYCITTTGGLKKKFKLYLETKKNYKNLNFYSFLDSKIDKCLVNAGIAETIGHAGLLIKHKKIKINNKIINSKLYFLKPGDSFSYSNNKFIIKKNNINIMYNFIFKNFIFIRYKKFKELNYNFKLDFNLIVYLLKIGKL